MRKVTFIEYSGGEQEALYGNPGNEDVVTKQGKKVVKKISRLLGDGEFEAFTKLKLTDAIGRISNELLNVRELVEEIL